MALTETIDLNSLHLHTGEGRHFELDTGLPSLELGEERYELAPSPVPMVLDVARINGQGYSLRLRFAASVSGPCMRCLEPAAPEFNVDAREISQPGGGEELESPYVEGGVLDLAGWANDALALILPTTILCKPGCLGLCQICGADLNRAGPEHHHDASPDPRWSKLSELKLD